MQQPIRKETSWADSGTKIAESVRTGPEGSALTRVQPPAVFLPIHEDAGEFPVSGRGAMQDGKGLLESRKAGERFGAVFPETVDLDRDLLPVGVGDQVLDPLFQEDGAVFLAKRREKPVERIGGHTAETVPEKTQLGQSRLSRQRGLLVAIAGEPIIQKIRHAVGLHRVGTVCNFRFGARPRRILTTNFLSTGWTSRGRVSPLRTG
jgi:hypothetical protein